MTWERRFDVASLIGAAFVAGWLANSGYYNLGHLWQQKNQLQTIQTKTIPQLRAQVRCEDKRADMASVVAGQAIIANAIDGLEGPSPAEIPKDNCPHPKQ